MLVVKELSSSVFLHPIVVLLLPIVTYPTMRRRSSFFCSMSPLKKKIDILFHTQTYDLNVRDIW